MPGVMGYLSDFIQEHVYEFTAKPFAFMKTKVGTISSTVAANDHSLPLHSSHTLYTNLSSLGNPSICQSQSVKKLIRPLTSSAFSYGSSRAPSTTIHIHSIQNTELGFTPRSSVYVYIIIYTVQVATYSTNLNN